MPFKPGQSGNPKGRPKAKWRELFEDALKADAAKYGTSLFEHAIIEARSDNTLLAAILRKCLPDLQAVKTEIIGGTPFSLIIGITPLVLPGNVPSDTKTLPDAVPVIPVKSIVTDVLTSKAAKIQPKVQKPGPTPLPKVKRKPTTRISTAKRRTKRTND